MVRDMKNELLPDAEDNNQQSVDDDVHHGCVVSDLTNYDNKLRNKYSFVDRFIYFEEICSYKCRRKEQNNIGEELRNTQIDHIYLFY